MVQKIFGFWGLFYFLQMALVSILFLETVNYIEHYGLQRKKLPNGEYEKVNILHSWNAPHRITNYLLFKL
jgi:alkane 1-monooxygenase